MPYPVLPEQTSMILPEQTSRILPEQTVRILPEQIGRILPEYTSRILLEQTSKVLPEPTSLIATNSTGIKLERHECHVDPGDDGVNMNTVTSNHTPTPITSRYSGSSLEVTCSICTARFASKGHLKRHMQAHGADRKFKCQVCDCSYSRHDNLRKHINTAHLDYTTQKKCIHLQNTH